MPELGRLRSANRNDTRLFRLSGEFDLSNAWKIEDALLASIREEHRDLVIDLSEVGFMDAQLVRALTRAREAAVGSDLAFVVIPPTNPTVGRVAGLIDFDVAA